MLDEQQHTTVDLDVSADAEFVDDEDGLAVLLTDRYGVRVRIALPDGAEAAGASSGLAWRIQRLEGPIRTRTLGYRAEHGPFNGPGALGPIVR